MEEELEQEEPTMDLEAEKEEPAEEGEDEDDGLLAGLDLQEGIEIEEDIEEDDLVNEIMKILGESEELLEEELIVDMGHEKDGTFRTDEATIQYYKEMQKLKIMLKVLH